MRKRSTSRFGACDAVAPKHAPVVVVGNRKDGSGKSTMAMHLIVGLLRIGRRVASIDLDRRQASLTRHIENRIAHAGAEGIPLPGPKHQAIDTAGEDEAPLRALIEGLCPAFDVIVIDTPGGDGFLNRLGHACADILITPVGDSLTDLQELARIEGRGMRIQGPSDYAEMVWEQKKVRARRGDGAMHWLVARNRRGAPDARHGRRMERLLGQLSRRFGFRVVSGFGERAVYAELLSKGLTTMDLRQTAEGCGLTMAQVAARQEVRALIAALGLR